MSDLAWLVEPCTTCNGHGMVTHAKAKTTLERAILHDCPDCDGSGVVPSAQAIEAGARSAFEAVRVQLSMAHWEGTTEHNRKLYRDMSRAVIEALLKGTE